MEMVNGYVFLDLTKANVYAKALKVLGADKPVVIKEGSGAPYFVDSLTLDGTNVVITKGGKTITIANDNTITSVGDIQEKLFIYTINLQDVTLESDVTLPNGKYLAIITNKNLNPNDDIPAGYYRAYNSVYGYNGTSYNIFELQIHEDGQVEVTADSGDMNNVICDDYQFSIYSKNTFIM